VRHIIGKLGVSIQVQVAAWSAVESGPAEPSAARRPAAEMRDNIQGSLDAGRGAGLIVGSRQALPVLASAAAVEEDLWLMKATAALYLVEHDLRGLSPAQLASVHRALAEAVRREIRRDSHSRYVQRIDVPGLPCQRRHASHPRSALSAACRNPIPQPRRGRRCARPAAGTGDVWWQLTCKGSCQVAAGTPPSPSPAQLTAGTSRPVPRRSRTSDHYGLAAAAMR
jgi:hypothetical protein